MLSPEDNFYTAFHCYSCLLVTKHDSRFVEDLTYIQKQLGFFVQKIQQPSLHSPGTPGPQLPAISTAPTAGTQQHQQQQEYVKTYHLL